jgi:hypothetical protein
MFEEAKVELFRTMRYQVNKPINFRNNPFCFVSTREIRSTTTVDNWTLQNFVI